MCDYGSSQVKWRVGRTKRPGVDHVIISLIIFLVGDTRVVNGDGNKSDHDK
jgi:hypothetical protein